MTGGDDGAAAWQVRADLRPGVLALTGHLGAAGTHAHAAVQVLVCTRGAVLLGDGHQRAAVRSAVIPAGARHCVTPDPGEPDPPQGWSLYVDTDGAAGQALHRRAAVTRWAAAAAGLLTGPEAGHPPTYSPWRSASARPRSPGTPHCPPHWPGCPTPSPRADRSASRKRGPCPPADWGTCSANSSACPSPPGCEARLRAAMDAARGGANPTEAAHAAGFADGAHLTRTFRAMFGITPSRALGGTHWQNR